VTQLREHRRVQNAERLAALIWHDNGLVFATPYGKPIDARADWQEWKELLADAGVRDARLHDARHTAATLLLLQGVDSRTVMSIMGWSAESQRVRYQHVVDELRAEAARRVGAMLWGDPAGDSATTGATSTRR
jgi:integrase